MKHKIQKEKNSKVEIEVTINNKDFLKYWDQAFKNIQTEIEMDGFRKGHAPENRIIAKYGESLILEEMSKLAIDNTYADIIINEKLKVISAPSVHIIKMSKDEDFVYHAHVEIYPEIKNFEYQSLIEETLKEKQEIKETTEEEIKQVMDSLSEEIKVNAQKDIESQTESGATPISLEQRIKDNMKLEKEYMEKSRLRSVFVEKLSKSIKEKYSDELPQSWDEKMFAQFAILNISQKEKIEIKEEEIEMEMIKMLAGVSPSSIPNYNEDNVKNYIRQIITNEKTLEKIGL